jgi:GrpB-like predicted nucleotidyltransferase (UPF0157 family)
VRNALSAPVHIIEYDPAWPERFASERALLERVVAPWLLSGVHHVGSTAVPGLAAKPIVDIMVGVRDLEEARAAIPLLEAESYCYFPYREYFHWFCKPSEAQRDFHMYLIEPTHPQWRARLAFRDRLRADPKMAAEYEALKRRLADEHHGDREAYTDAKTAFVERVVAESLDLEN